MGSILASVDDRDEIVCFENVRDGILTFETGNLEMSQVRQRKSVWHLYAGKFGCAYLSCKR